MKIQLEQIMKTDVLVLGGGAAGLRAAIEARRKGVEVCLVSSSRAGFGCNSSISHGGFSAVSAEADKSDSPRLHYEDTLRSGCGINSSSLVRILTENVWGEVKELEDMGVHFLKKSSGEYQRVPRGGHSRDRRLATPRNSGMSFVLPLLKHSKKLNVRALDGWKALRLLTSEGRILGALLMNEEGCFLVAEAKAVVLATGGGGAIYSRTTNVPSAVGEGYALAYRAGLTLQDMEFVQFVVTPLKKAGTPGRIPPCETLLIKGAVLRNGQGENLFDALSIPFTLTRDVIAQVVHRGISDTRNPDDFVYLDVSGLSKSDLCLAEFPPGKMFRVTPCSHFFMGGVRVEEDLTTPVAGLFVAGEIMGGVHGANRLGGNALAETFVFGAVAGRKAALFAREIALPHQVLHRIALCAVGGILDRYESAGTKRSSIGDYSEMISELRNTMSSSAGVIRDKNSLREGVERLCSIRRTLYEMPLPEPTCLWKATSTEEMLLVGEMILESALKREESRGAHFREDYPQRDDRRFMVNILVKENRSGEIALSDVMCR